MRVSIDVPERPIPKMNTIFLADIVCPDAV
jgi:hypothetical protein